MRNSRRAWMIPAAITLGLLLAACGRQGMEHMTGSSPAETAENGETGAQTDGTGGQNQAETGASQAGRKKAGASQSEVTAERIGGSYFNPNLPTEECFISPKRGEAEGIVYSSKPLSYQGQLIEDFSIRFERGRAVEAHARTNEALLQKLIAMDDGAAYLGECALVPYDSPINQTGILFYNTLFDENACCHLALGMGFIDTIRDYPNRSLEEMRALGVNDSMIHEDFMIGTPDLAITAHCRGQRARAAAHWRLSASDSQYFSALPSSCQSSRQL